jgi:hypothetical protein
VNRKTRFARSWVIAVGLTLLTVLIGSSLARAASSDPVRVWNGHALDAIRGFNSTRANGAVDAYGARLLAMLNVAMYDAVNGIESHHGQNNRRDFAHVATHDAPAQGNVYVAASAAAHAILVGLVPEKAAIYDAQRDSDMATFGAAGPKDAGRQWGEYVGAQVLAARATDGSSPADTQSAGSGPGQFRALWSGVQFRNLAPFGISPPAPGDAPHYSGSGKPALTDPYV